MECAFSYIQKHIQQVLENTDLSFGKTLESAIKI